MMAVQVDNSQDKKEHKENIVELISDKKNKFLTSFINKESSLFISSILDDEIIKTFFEKTFGKNKRK